jgi:hypothetical protein
MVKVDLAKRKRDFIACFKLIPQESRLPARQYANPKGYVAHDFIHKAKQVTKIYGELEVNEIYVMCKQMYELMEVAKTEPYFLSPDLLLPLLQTDLPDLSHPYQDVAPFLEVMVPLGMLFDEDGDSVCCITIVDYEVISRLFGYSLSIDPSDGELRYSIIARTEGGATIHVPVYANSELNPSAEGDGVIYNEELMPILDKIKAVGMNLLLLLEAYPDYVSHIPVPNPLQQKGFGKPKKKLLAPRVIGADFLTRKVTPSTSPNQPTKRIGKAKSPHIRRGHWRRSRHGQGRRQYRWNWIQPRMINF